MKYFQDCLKETGVTLLDDEKELVAGGGVAATTTATVILLAGLAKSSEAHNGICSNGEC